MDNFYKKTETSVPRVATVWTTGLSTETKTQFVEGLISNPYLKLLRKILEVRNEARRRKSISEDFYKEPQWAIRRAYSDGKDSELQFVLDLLTFGEKQ